MPIPRKTILCEYGGLVDLETRRHQRALQMEVPNSDEKTMLLSKYVFFCTLSSCCLLMMVASRSLQYDELRGSVHVQGEEDEEDAQRSRDRLVIDGFFHSNIGASFNDFRLDPFKDGAAGAGKKGQGEVPPRQTCALSRSAQNCQFVEVEIFGWSHVFVVTLADLAPGVELTVDYGEPFWETLRFHRVLSTYAERTQQLNEDSQGDDIGRRKLMPFRAFLDLLSKL